jgi:hypothetical protein
MISPVIAIEGGETEAGIRGCKVKSRGIGAGGGVAGQAVGLCLP